jgi:biotin carboxyl carrier protein
MSIYNVSIGKNEYQVEIHDNQFKVDGETVKATLIALRERGEYLLRRGAWKSELHVQVMGNRQYLLDANGRHALAKVNKNIGHQIRIMNTTNDSDLVAPMPGVVVSVHVTEGDLVEFGQMLVVLESMKMQMEMHAPCAGKVARVNARPGTLMAKGDLLVKIDPV